MGLYRVAIYFNWQFLIGIKYEIGFTIIELPIVSIYICIKKDAKGFYFGK